MQVFDKNTNYEEWFKQERECVFLNKDNVFIYENLISVSLKETIFPNDDNNHRAYYCENCCDLFESLKINGIDIDLKSEMFNIHLEYWDECYYYYGPEYGRLGISLVTYSESEKDIDKIREIEKIVRSRQISEIEFVLKTNFGKIKFKQNVEYGVPIEPNPYESYGEYHYFEGFSISTLDQELFGEII